MPEDRLFLDTSFVLALINERDQYHAQAESLSHRFENSPLVTTDAVLLEIGNALAKDFKREAAEVIRLLRRSKRVEVFKVDDRLFNLGMDVYEKFGDKAWGLVDCISFVAVRESGCAAVLTFDGDFAQAGFTIVKS